MEYNKDLFVFDLDNTIGSKTPFYPAITKENIRFIQKLSDSGHLVCFATDRPKPLALRGMHLAGLSNSEIKDLFPIRIYEDGLFIEVNEKIIYNALDFVSPIFKELRQASFSEEAVDFFAKHGFSLHQESVIENIDGNFFHADYEGNNLRKIDLVKDITPVYQENNLIKETYKFPNSFFENIESLRKNSSLLKETISRYFSGKFKDWEKTASLKQWTDAVDLYPKLDDDGMNRKAIAMSMALSRLDISKLNKSYICCDSVTDAILIEWAQKRFSNYLAVCPSNLKKELGEFLAKQNLNFIILNEDCNNLYKGLKRVIGL